MIFLDLHENALLVLLLALVQATCSANSSIKYKYPGWAIRCDGVNDWASLPIPNLPNDFWTLEGWVKFNSLKTSSLFHMYSGDDTILRLVTSRFGDSQRLQLQGMHFYSMHHALVIVTTYLIYSFLFLIY